MFTLGAFVRRDHYNYYPSNNPFADLGPIQQETVSRTGSSPTAGLRSDLSYVKGIHNLKAGATYQQTFLDEDTRFGIIDPFLNAPCLMQWRANRRFQRAINCLPPNQPNVATNPIATSPFAHSRVHDLTRPTPASGTDALAPRVVLISLSWAH